MHGYFSLFGTVWWVHSYGRYTLGALFLAIAVVGHENFIPDLGFFRLYIVYVFRWFSSEEN